MRRWVIALAGLPSGRMKASATIKIAPDRIAPSTLKKEAPIESRKTTGIARPRIRRNLRRVLGLVRRAVVARRVPVDRRQQQPTRGERPGVDRHREPELSISHENGPG